MSQDDLTAQADAILDADAADAAGEVARLTAENAALKDQALRSLAEAENTKRRAEREANDARAFAIQRFARDLLDAADNMQRALAASPKGESADPAISKLIAGIEMTERALQTAFERNGLKRIEPQRGDRFDPNLHQAMMEQPADDLPPGVVNMVAQSGYELFGRVVRPATVAVTPKAAATPTSTGEGTVGYAGANGAAAGGAVDTKA